LHILDYKIAYYFGIIFRIASKFFRAKSSFALVENTLDYNILPHHDYEILVRLEIIFHNIHTIFQNKSYILIYQAVGRCAIEPYC
jgi:hypothetical protein